ncbi:hypothetical protein [Oceanipulchritudo coccoides]|uniref:hypothetical protein n=1 Tax=Oceanipulchritudo coccoides TaxID=2706888 RepID=UPI001EE7B999|nr:hypothetical protein [Oceanipulchritudo coccoides]
MSGNFFLDNCSYVFCPHLKTLRKTAADPENLDWTKMNAWDASFIGCHAYTMGPGFRKALQKAYEWCDQLDWLDSYTRRLMLPFYLPLAGRFVGAKVAGLPEVCVLRGMQLSEYENLNLGTSGWNSGFLMLCVYAVLKNGDLESNRELDPIRRRFMKNAGVWSLVCIQDKRVGFRKFAGTIQRSGGKSEFWAQLRIWQALSLWLKNLFGLRGYKARRKYRREAVTVDKFFGILDSCQKG